MFKDRYRDFQHIVRELFILREHNKSFKPDDPQDRLLLFAEASVVLLAIERFLRILPGVEAVDDNTLHSLLEKATSQSRKILHLSAKDRNDAITRIGKVRNTILHGNFEQAASQAGLKTVEEYFQKHFASEIEALFEILDSLVKQIDPETGEPYRKPQ